MQLDILLLTPRWWSLWNKLKYWQKYHVVSHAMQTHAFKLSWCTSCTLLRNPCPKIHAPTPLWCIACDTLHVALKLLLLCMCCITREFPQVFWLQQGLWRSCRRSCRVNMHLCVWTADTTAIVLHCSAPVA